MLQQLGHLCGVPVALMLKVTTSSELQSDIDRRMEFGVIICCEKFQSCESVIEFCNQMHSHLVWELISYCSVIFFFLLIYKNKYHTHIFSFIRLKFLRSSLSHVSISSMSTLRCSLMFYMRCIILLPLCGSTCVENFEL